MGGGRGHSFVTDNRLTCLDATLKLLYSTRRFAISIFSFDTPFQNGEARRVAFDVILLLEVRLFSAGQTSWHRINILDKIILLWPDQDTCHTTPAGQLRGAHIPTRPALIQRIEELAVQKGN